MLSIVLVAAILAATEPDALLAHAQALMGRGEYGKAIAELEPLASQSNLTPLQRARLFHQMAAARSQVGPADAALKDADRAEAAARSIDAFDILSRIESVRGVIWFSRGKSSESLAHFKECLNWAKKSGQPALIAGAYIRIAAAYQDAGDWTPALDAVNRSIEADPHPSDAARVQYLTRRGLLEIEVHEGEAAKASISDALALTRKIGDRRTEAQILIDMALVTERVDRDAAAAAALAAQAVTIARSLRLTAIEIPALNQLGSLLRAAGKLLEAKQALQRAQTLTAETNDQRDEPYVLKNLGQVFVRLGNLREGQALLQRAVVGSSRVDLQACKLEYSIVSPK